jgi:hypothetical protein
MSLGYGYDMVLLPPRHPTDGDHELSQPGEALHRYHRSRQARAARRRRASATAIIASRGVTVFPNPTPLNQTLARISSSRTNVG